MEEAKDIINYLYNKTDAEHILTELEIYQVQSSPGKKNYREKQKKEEKKRVKFHDFTETILNFQLNSH